MNAIYRIAAGSDGFFYADPAVVVNGGTVTAIFWFRILSGGAASGTQFLFADKGGLGLFATLLDETYGLTVYNAETITEAATTRDVDTWYLATLVNDTVTNDVEFFIDGVSVGSAVSAIDELDGDFLLGGVPVADALADIEFTSVIYYDSGKSAASLVALSAAGIDHDPGVTFGDWTGDVPPLWWHIGLAQLTPDYLPTYLDIEPNGAGVTNSGDGGAGTLAAFRGGVSDDSSDFWAWPISTHRIGVYSTAWWPGSALIASNWHLTYDAGEVTTGERVFGECPRVARVTMRADGVLLVDVDAVLQPRVTYVLSVDVDDLAANNPGDMSVDGPVPAREHTADLVPALLDIDAPLRAGLRVTDSGDFGMASETRTVEKMLWALVLTPRGSVDWDPQFGSALRAKRLRPMDLKKEHRRLVALAMGVPYVKAAAVQLLFEGDEIVVEFNITSDFGSFYTRRAVDAS